jgi:hypothetical protein
MRCLRIAAPGVRHAQHHVVHLHGRSKCVMVFYVLYLKCFRTVVYSHTISCDQREVFLVHICTTD